MKRHMADEIEFQKLLDLHKIEYFTAEEVFRPFTRHPLGTVPNVLDWEHIIPALLIFDALRKATGLPIIIESSFRNSLHNAEIGGAKNSQHKYFTALDGKGKTLEATNKIKDRIRQWLKNDDLEIYFKGKRITPAMCGVGLSYDTIWHIDVGVLFGTRKIMSRW